MQQESYQQTQINSHKIPNKSDGKYHESKQINNCKGNKINNSPSMELATTVVISGAQTIELRRNSAATK